MPNDWAVSIPFGQEKVVSTVRHERKLGTIGYTPDGRKFRWALADGAIGAGQVVAAKVPIAAHDMDLSVLAAAVGDMTVTVTIPTTATTANQYEDAPLYVNDGAGEGHLYIVKSHPAGAAGSNVVFTLWEPIREAWVAATTLVGLYENRYFDVVVSPTTTVNQIVGVAPTEIANNEYFWVQTGGQASVLVDGTLVLGQMVQPSQGTAGAVIAADFAGTTEWQLLGVVDGVLAVTTDYQSIKLFID